MVDRDRTQKFLTEVEQLWGSPLLRAVPKPLRDWAKSKILGEAFEELRRLVLEGRPPVILLIGRNGPEKSALINALCAQAVAEANDPHPAEGTSDTYRALFDGGTAWDLVDSRGLFASTAPGSGPDKDAVKQAIQDVVAHQPDIILHVVSLAETQTLADDLAVLGRIQSKAGAGLGHRVPTLMVLTGTDMLGDPREWPPEQHSRQAALIAETVERITQGVPARSRKKSTALVPDAPLYGRRPNGSNQCQAVIPVSVAAGRSWNVATVHELIGQELPEEAQLQFYQALGRKDLLRKIASRLTTRLSKIAAGVGVSPLPVADFIVLGPLQVLLVVMIGGLSCRPVGLGTAHEYLGAVGMVGGAGLGLRLAAQQLVKLMPVPVLAQAVSAAIAGGGTYAIGRSAEAYFFSGKAALPEHYAVAPPELPPWAPDGRGAGAE